MKRDRAISAISVRSLKTKLSMILFLIQWMQTIPKQSQAEAIII